MSKYNMKSTLEFKGHRVAITYKTKDNLINTQVVEVMAINSSFIYCIVPCTLEDYILKLRFNVIHEIETDLIKYENEKE